MRASPLPSVVRAAIVRGSSIVLAFSLLATNVSAQGPAFGPCVDETTAPAAIVEALDAFTISLADPDAPKAAITGYATGGVVSVTGPDWRYVRSIGTIATNSDEPIRCDMPYQIGSATKMMTAVVLLQLHEEGALSVDDQLSVHMPGYAAALPNGEVITLRQLANHTAGVFSYTNDAPDGSPGLMAGGVADRALLIQGYTPSELVDFVIRHGAPSFPPGQDGAWDYSNTGYIIMGQIIEQVTGMPLESVFEKRIFGPLAMSHTYLWNDISKPSFGLSDAYLSSPFNVETTFWNMSQGWAAGAVISTVQDMTTFISALLEGRLFKDRSTLDLMQETVPTNFPLMTDYGIGLGVKGIGAWGHAGQTLGFTSDTAYYPDENIAIVMWANSSRSPVGTGVLSLSLALSAAGVIAQ